MADDLQENTQAQDKQTEALEETSKRIEELSQQIAAAENAAGLAGSAHVAAMLASMKGAYGQRADLQERSELARQEKENADSRLELLRREIDAIRQREQSRAAPPSTPQSPKDLEPKANSASDLSSFFEGAVQGISDGFYANVLERLQGGKKLIGEAPGTLEEKFRQSWDRGEVLDVSDLSRISDEHFNSQRINSNAPAPPPPPPAPPPPPPPPPAPPPPVFGIDEKYRSEMANLSRLYQQQVAHGKAKEDIPAELVKLTNKSESQATKLREQLTPVRRQYYEEVGEFAETDALREQARTFRFREGEKESRRRGRQSREMSGQQYRQRQEREKEDDFVRHRGQQDADKEATRTVRIGNQFRKQQQEQAELRRTQGPLPELLGEYEKRANALRDYYRGGGGPDDIGATALRTRVREQETLVGRKFANMTPEDQRQAQPQMEAAEQRRSDILSDELQLRQKLNGELKKSRGSLSSFARELLHIGGTHSGSLGAVVGASLDGPSAIVAALATWVMGQERKYDNEVHRGGITLSPSAEQTSQRSADIAAAVEAERTGERERKESEAFRDQLRAQARAMPGWARRHDPLDWMNSFEFDSDWFGRAAEADNSASDHYVFNRLRMPKARAEAIYNNEIASYYQRWIRHQGGTPLEEPKKDIVLPVAGGISGGPGQGSGALQYQAELQVNSLRREDASNELLRLQLESLNRLGDLFQGIDQKFNGLENQGWAG